MPRLDATVVTSFYTACQLFRNSDKSFRTVVLNRGGVKQCPGGRETLNAPQHGNFLRGTVFLPNMAFCSVTVHLHDTNFLQYSRRVLLCNDVYSWPFNCTWLHSCWMWDHLTMLTSRPKIDSTLLCMCPSHGDTHLLNLGTVSFIHTKRREVSVLVCK